LSDRFPGFDHLPNPLLEALSLDLQTLSIQCSDSGPINLVEDQIHVWRVDLDNFPVNSLQAVLSADELLRASRYRFERDHDRFIAARSVLRILISTYLLMEPQRLIFGYGEYGKPHLNLPAPWPTVRFSVAHSDRLALYAISKDRELGVDVEFIRDDFANEAVAERFFSPNEIAQLRSVPVKMWTTAFFNCWTRKESFIKARGEGLSIPLNIFDVSLVPDKPAALLSYQPDSAEVSRWSMQEIPVESGFAAALTSEGNNCELRMFDLK